MLEATIEMSLRKCQKSKTNSQRYVGRRKGLVCTEMCGCIGCENEMKEYIVE